VQHRDGAGRCHGKRQYLSHVVCRWERSGRTKVITDVECRAWRRGGYVYYLIRPAVSDGVSRRGRARECVMVDGSQWRMGEVDVDGWGSGPLSESD
jgi:hypothetical protein